MLLLLELLLELLLLLLLPLFVPLFSQWFEHLQQQKQQLQQQQHLCQFHFNFVLFLFQFCFIFVLILLQTFFRHLFEFYTNTPFFGRTDLRKGVSQAKFDVEADFDVKKSLAPPKSSENHEKPKKKCKKIFEKKFQRQKIRKLQIV